MNFFYLLFLLISLLAGISDFLFYKIPNKMIVFMLGLFIVKSLVSPGAYPFYSSYLIFLAFICIGLIFYNFKIMGGGDVKFLSTGALWLTQINLTSFLLFTALLGGVLSVVYLFFSDTINRVRISVQNFLIRLLGERFFLLLFATDRSSIVTVSNSHQREKKHIVIPYGIPITLACWFTLMTQIVGN